MRGAVQTETTPGRGARSYLLLRRPLGGADLREKADGEWTQPANKSARAPRARPPARENNARPRDVSGFPPPRSNLPPCSSGRRTFQNGAPGAAARPPAAGPGASRAQRCRERGGPGPRGAPGLAGRRRGACAGRGHRSPSSWASWRRGGRVPGACGPRRAESLREAGLPGRCRSSRRPSCWDPPKQQSLAKNFGHLSR